MTEADYWGHLEFRLCREFAGMADKIDGRQVPVEPGLLNIVKRAPVGVVGQIALGGSRTSPTPASASTITNVA